MNCELHFRFSRTYLGFEVFLEMIAGEIERLFVSLQTSHHEAAFKRTGNQGSQFQGIDVRADLASASALLRNQSQTIKQRSEGLPGLARSWGLPSSESMAVFSSGHPPGTSP